MKNNIKFISLAFVLKIMALLLFSMAFVMGVNAKSAKTPKNYVKSISVKKKDAITIPAAKNTVTKNYAVTVKVKGSASKAFTAKSDKAAVAAVKVSGSKINVTAKKAGTAKITVTTKAKNSKNKKLSATLALTVTKAVKKASIKSEYQLFNLRYADFLDCKKAYFTSFKLLSAIENRRSGAVYSAEISDKNVLAAEKLSGGDTLIYTVGAGEAYVDVYETYAGKKTKVGKLQYEIEKSTMSDIMSDISTEVDTSSLEHTWINQNFGKVSRDFGSDVKSVLFNTPKLGVDFEDKDYTMSFVCADESIAAVNNGVITGLRQGSTSLNCTMVFTDESEYTVSTTIHVSGYAIEKNNGYTMENVREHIVGLNTPVSLADGTQTPLINFDNAATTPAFEAVQKAIDTELEMYGSIGRGFSQKSNHSTDIYNNTRDKVLEFLGADPEKYTCFYVNSTTDGLNKLASAIIESEKDVVLTTRIEHHANDLSWRERCKVVYAEVDKNGRVDYNEIEKMLKANKVKYVSVTAASNVTGYVTDVHRVAKLAHQYGAKIIVDGAQIVAHRKFSMVGDTPEENIDFFVFSAHKMYSPYGGGAVIGLTEVLNQHMPEFYGGGTIKVVGDDWVKYKDAPAAYEAGSPNYPAVVGLGKAIDILSEVGMENIQAHELVLNRKLIDGLKKINPNVIIYGDSENIEDRVGVITFNYSDINTYYISKELSELGAVATRRGAFCAHPYVWRLMNIDEETQKSFESCTDDKTAGMVRVSFGIYNNEEEVDKMLEILPQVLEKAKEDTQKSGANAAY